VSSETAVQGASLARPYTLVYDGDCRVCSRIANAIRKWDRQHQIDVMPSQLVGVMERFPWIPARAFSEAIQLVGPGGRTWQGAEATEQLLHILPRGRWIRWIFHVPFARALADRFYRWFARHRYHLGCAEHCQARPIEDTQRD
jgi:predicted DCC family thiol-disulfide oxidoreductase YuxK